MAFTPHRIAIAAVLVAYVDLLRGCIRDASNRYARGI